MAKKSQPLSLEDLLESQKTMLTASNLTEEQRKRAEDQIAKLEELRQATTKSQEKQTEVVEQVKVMTRASLFLLLCVITRTVYLIPPSMVMGNSFSLTLSPTKRSRIWLFLAMAHC